jgi:hypothetical protein
MGVSPPPPGSPSWDNPWEGTNSTITMRRSRSEVPGTVPSLKASVLLRYAVLRNSAEPDFHIIEDR